MRIALSPDRLTAMLCVAPGEERPTIDPSTVLALLAARGVARDVIDEPAIAAAIEDYGKSDPGAEFQRVIARGRPPTPGRDAGLTLEPELSAVLAGTAREQEGDHYNRSSLAVVRAGQKLGVLVPPEAGVDGVDVEGKAIAAREPRTSAIEPDESLVIDKDGVVAAAHAGVVEQRGHVLRVLPTLKLAGCVDFSTGNIDFPGEVEVAENIRECFTVKVGVDLRVRGLVEAATVDVARDAALYGGMAGEKGRLSVGRDLCAKYLKLVSGVIARDAVIDKELAACELTIGRSLKSPGCSVIGGRLVLGGESEVGQVGNEAGVATEVVLGKIPDLERVVERGLELLPQIAGKLGKARDELGQLKANASKLMASQAEELTELEFKVSELRGKVLPLADGVNTVLSTMAAYATVRLTVTGVVYPGTVLCVGRFCARVKEPIKGPVRIELSAGEDAAAGGQGGGDPVVRDIANGRLTPMKAYAAVSPDPRYVDAVEARRTVASIRAAA